jgi:hypothetical protein
MTAAVAPIKPTEVLHLADVTARSVGPANSNRRQAREATDHDLARAMTLGALVGVPLTYMLGVTLAVFALGMSRFGTALAIGAIAALFGGFWVGGLGMMIHAGKADAHA